MVECVNQYYDETEDGDELNENRVCAIEDLEGYLKNLNIDSEKYDFSKPYACLEKSLTEDEAREMILNNEDFIEWYHENN